MDSKRVIIAIVLSMIVLFGWQMLFPPPPRVTDNAQNRTSQEGPNGTARPVLDETLAATPPKDVPVVKKGREILVETPLYAARINAYGGVLTEFSLKRYKQTIDADSPLVDMIGPEAARLNPLALSLGADIEWTPCQDKDISLSGVDQGVLTFTGSVMDLKLVRELSFTGDSYLIRDNVRVLNQGAETAKVTPSFTMAMAKLSAKDNKYDLTQVAFYQDSGLTEEGDKDDLSEKWLKSETGLKWGGVQSNYFLAAIIPDNPGGLFMARMEGDLYRTQVLAPMGGIKPGAEGSASCSYFFGPKETEILNAMPGDLAKAQTYGWFDFIAKPMLVGVNFIYDYVGNYGVAIIILTIFIKLLFWPLATKSYKSMNQMKKLQPMLTKIREKYKDDRQKMNAEMMSLYKTYKVNPAGGCLPMVLQIPVFIGLYQALLKAIELRHAPFITHVPFTDITWLADLSAKDPFYVTPIIMGLTMFLQQKMTPSPGDPTQAKIMLFMPLIFTFLFLSFPSGLVVYWLMNNVLSIAQQQYIMKKYA